MQLKPEEISQVIRSQIKYYENTIRQNETGTVLNVGDGIARASGLINCMAGEPVQRRTLPRACAHGSGMARCYSPRLGSGSSER